MGDKRKTCVPKVRICAACLKASCWQGVFHCEGYKMATAILLCVPCLQRINRENPSYWCGEHEEVERD